MCAAGRTSSTRSAIGARSGCLGPEVRRHGPSRRETGHVLARASRVGETVAAWAPNEVFENPRPILRCVRAAASLPGARLLVRGPHPRSTAPAAADPSAGFTMVGRRFSACGLFDGGANVAAASTCPDTPRRERKAGGTGWARVDFDTGAV